MNGRATTWGVFKAYVVFFGYKLHLLSGLGWIDLAQNNTTYYTINLIQADHPV